MTKTTIRYSDCFKRSVVEEIEQAGLSIGEARRRWDIRGGSTIQKWLVRYGKNHLLNKVLRVETKEERDELTRLRQENKALKQAYAELSMHHRCSEKVIEVADELFGTDLKKSTNKGYLRFTGKRNGSRHVQLFCNK